MTFDEFDVKMRKFEQSLDICVAPELYIAARIDGRSFTRLTKELCDFEAPFDIRFRDCMVGTVRHLMNCGFNIVYGYTQSDEISLLFHPSECSFGRKTRKLNSILAGEASAAFTHLLGMPAAFDCRVIPLPSVEAVRDYFLWRQEDAHRNALNGHCYWLLRKEGLSSRQATSRIEGQSIAWKKDLLAEHRISFDDLPSWQRRGTGVYWESYEKEGENPITGEKSIAVRRRLKENYELPSGSSYSNMISACLELESLIAMNRRYTNQSGGNKDEIRKKGHY